MYISENLGVNTYYNLSEKRVNIIYIYINFRRNKFLVLSLEHRTRAWVRVPAKENLPLFLKFENRNVTIFIVKLCRIAVLNILFFSASAIINHY